MQVYYFIFSQSFRCCCSQYPNTLSFSGYADVYRCIYGFPTAVLYVHRLFTGIESCIVLITDFCLTWKTLYKVHPVMIFNSTRD